MALDELDHGRPRLLRMRAAKSSWASGSGGNAVRSDIAAQQGCTLTF